jgi:hypothetical protein
MALREWKSPGGMRQNQEVAIKACRDTSPSPAFMVVWKSACRWIRQSGGQTVRQRNKTGRLLAGVWQV